MKRKVMQAGVEIRQLNGGRARAIGMLESAVQALSTAAAGR